MHVFFYYTKILILFNFTNKKEIVKRNVIGKAGTCGLQKSGAFQDHQQNSQISLD